jgi:hypothetical protein
MEMYVKLDLNKFPNVKITTKVEDKVKVEEYTLPDEVDSFESVEGKTDFLLDYANRMITESLTEIHSEMINVYDMKRS